MRSLVGYYNRQAVISLDEFNALPAQQQVLTVIHETLRRIQVDMMGDLSLPTTMALEETAQALVAGHNQNLNQLPFFKIMAERLTQSPQIRSICEKSAGLSGLAVESKNQLKRLCADQALIENLSSRGLAGWANQFSSIILRETRSTSTKPFTVEHKNLLEDVSALEFPNLFAGYVVPFAPVAGAAAAAIRQASVNLQFNIYSLNYERADREATCEILKQLQW
jgi:hypothetical protein